MKAERDEAAVLRALDRLNDLLSSRDSAFVDEFAAAGAIRLVGSEAGEIAESREAIAVIAERLFALPFRLSWEWSRRSATVRGAVAWVFADGHVALDRNGVIERLPYRMTGVLELTGADWRWRQFHGSEPAASPADAGTPD